MADYPKADANPTKAFFVRMITRDISLEDCILDLIDNSVDAAWTNEGGPAITLADRTDLSKYRIEIEASAGRFCIKDNCGGISLDDAANYAFTFGRKDEVTPDKFSIGVYGIGMKRAVFKLGADIKVYSTHQTNDRAVESYVVPINVPRWLDPKRGWDFDIEPSDPASENGLKIDVTDLTTETQTSLGNPLFLETLKRTISRAYSLHLHLGLVILVNGERVDGWQITLLQSDDLAPMSNDYYDEESKAVRVEILAGMGGTPPESSEPSEEDTKENRYGWYIICNGRVVLAADRTTVAGWGTDDWPQWHPQYAGFIGLILFTAEDASLLPLTTTKRSIDTAAGVFRRARPRMREVSKQWIAYTNARKQALADAKQIEAKARPVAIYTVAQRPAVSLPRIVAKPVERSASIQYSMPLVRVRELADSFGNINMSYKDVGVKSFEYAFADKVGSA